MINIPKFLYRIAYSDTDAGGIVYHARYFEIAERSRNEHLHHFGYTFNKIHKEFNLQFVVNMGKGIYKSPAFLDDLLLAQDEIEYYSPAMIIWKTSFKRLDMDICSIIVRLAAIAPDSHQISIIPDQILELFGRIQESLKYYSGIF